MHQRFKGFLLGLLEMILVSQERFWSVKREKILECTCGDTPEKKQQHHGLEGILILKPVLLHAHLSSCTLEGGIGLLEHPPLSSRFCVSSGSSTTVFCVRSGENEPELS